MHQVPPLTSLISSGENGIMADFMKRFLAGSRAAPPADLDDRDASDADAGTYYLQEERVGLPLARKFLHGYWC